MLVHQSQKRASKHARTPEHHVAELTQVTPSFKFLIILQVRSKLLVSFRSRQVEVHVPEFVPEAEQQLLGAALKQWQNSAEGAVASSALDMQIAEQCLRQTTYRCCHVNASIPSQDM